MPKSLIYFFPTERSNQVIKLQIVVIVEVFNPEGPIGGTNSAKKVDIE
jgi:hypothetical protein